jgi:hypothetical protein
MSQPEFNQAVRRLAQYRPFEEGGRDVQIAVRDLLLAASAVEGNGFPSLQAAKDGILALWGMDVEIDELREVVAALAASGYCVSAHGGFRLTEQARAELEATATGSEDTERQAFADWERAVRAHRPDLGDEDFTVLKADLAAWLGQVIARHGVESALILYPENPRAQELFEAIEKLGLAFLPRRGGCLGEIREYALQLFVRQPSPAQRTYLADLLNTAFYMTVLTLDSEASRLVQERVRGHRLYLDTNFIYTLLGLGGTAAETLSAVRLLELTTAMGYELAVTRWTADELRSSLRASEARLQRVPLPRQDLAELMCLKAGESDITKAYWMKYRETSIRPKDFFAFYTHVETVLEQHGVKEVTEGCVAVDQNRAAIDGQVVLLQRFTADKEEVVLEHDAKHRLLVERLRGDGTVGFSNARCWFLTRDTKLPRYALATLDGSHVDLPFCVGTSAWVQVMRAFTPRTEDFDKSLVELLATPYLRYRGGPGISPRVVDAVVGRVDAYKGASPKLASEVLADTALVDDIASARTDAEREAKVENAFIMKSEELRERAEASERREAEERASRVAAEEEARRADKLREAEAARLAAAEAAHEEELRAERESHERQAREREAERERSEAALKGSAEDERQRRERAERLLTAGGTAGLVLAAIALIAVAIFAHMGVAWICAVASVAALALCGAARLGLGRERGSALLQFAFGFAGIVGLIITVVLAVKP